jgi:hypothetical protein
MKNNHKSIPPQELGMFFYGIKSRIAILFIGALVTSIGVTANPVQAETGKEKIELF